MSLGIAAYNNMNVLDGFAAVHVARARRHNLRMSRELRPDMTQALGKLRMEVVSPFQEIHYILEANDAPFQFDMVFQKFMEPVLEEPHMHRAHGRVTQDYLRFNQLMTASGTLQIEGRTFTAARWFGWRDHRAGGVWLQALHRHRRCRQAQAVSPKVFARSESILRNSMEMTWCCCGMKCAQA